MATSPDERWQQRRDEPAEDEQRQQQHDRQRDQLGALEIAANGRVDLLVGDRPAAEHDARVAGELAAETGRRVLRADVEPVVEEAEDEAPDDRASGQPRGRRRSGRGPPRRHPPDERDDSRIGLDTRRVLQQVEGPDALRARILEQAGAALQPRDDRPAERERDRR